MGSLSPLSDSVAGRSVALLMAAPLLGIIGSELYDRYGSLPPAQAVVVFGVVAGTTQLGMQGVASSQFDSLGRNIHIAEMVPPVVTAVLTSLVIAYALSPPSPLNPVTNVLRESGSLPS